jgi:rhamnosyltransferase
MAPAALERPIVSSDQQDRAGTGAVIVAFHPDPDQLNTLLKSLVDQVDSIVVIDNSQPAATIDKPTHGPELFEIIRPGSNIGVAAAINRGIARLVETGHHHALLLDQDSELAENMVATLSRTLHDEERNGQSVAAIGPAIRDRCNGKTAPFIRFRLPFNQRIRQVSGSANCDFLITSGTLVNLAHWQAIGSMREPWFIDSIDLEWCFRARRMGFAIIGCFDTELQHSIGESRLLWTGTHAPRYRHHRPERLYTMMRNRVFLYRSRAPLAWVIQDLLRTTGKLLLFALIPPRRTHLAKMLKGLRDGIFTRPVP